MATFKVRPLPVRKEVQEFLLAAEKLLAPVLRETELTPEECHVISEYLMTMCRDNHPWSGYFKPTVAGQASSMATDQPTRQENP